MAKKKRKELQIASVELPNINTKLKGEVKGTLDGIRGKDRNDLKRKDWRKLAKANKITRFGKSGHMLIPGSGGAKYDVVPIIDPTKKSKKNKRKNKKYTA